MRVLALLLGLLALCLKVGSLNSERLYQVGEVATGEIAFVGGDHLLYLLDLETGSVTLLSNSFTSNPAWSPDGNQIAYDDSLNIYSLDLRTRELRQLTDAEGQSIRPIWSPDGESLAFTSDRDGNWELYLMQSDGTDQTRLTVNEAIDGYNGLTWSPDGKSLAFVRDGETVASEREGYYEQMNILQLDIESAKTATGRNDSLVNLTAHIDECPTGEIYYNPIWSPANHYLAFSLSCGGDYMDVFILDLADTSNQQAPEYFNVTQATSVDQDGYRGISWSPEGAYLAIISLDVQASATSSRIFIFDVEEITQAGKIVAEELLRAADESNFYGLAWRLDITLVE